MEARITVDGVDDVDGALSSLLQWLTAEDEFRGRLRLDRAPVQPGDMGVLSDALSVAISGEGALTVLAGSIAVWLRQRRSTIKVKIVNADGSVQEISASGPSADAIAAKVEPHKHG